MSNPPTCVTCKYFKRDRSMPSLSKCLSPKCSRDDLVGVSNGNVYCSTARMFDSRCGAEGKHWEPQEISVPWWKRLLKIEVPEQVVISTLEIESGKTIRINEKQYEAIKYLLEESENEYE